MVFHEIPPVTLVSFMALFGLINCFFGYRIFRFLIGVWGFLVGISLAGSLCQWMDINGFWNILISLTGGVIGAAAAFMLYILGVFFLGAAFGYFVSLMIWSDLSGGGALLGTIIIILLGGVAAVSLQRPLIVMITAYMGAWMLVGGIRFFLNPHITPVFTPGVPSIQELFAFVGWLVLGTLGMAFQVGLSVPPPEKKRREE